ncbi:rhomboid family intramembrane serine protease [Nocardioides sp. YIM 152315]|uniref:rhomboid family intramembrane serine protease n=1 Tax=Nocardioides sp. YIM 152315 TaxID=3031760 RepID=UPI0023DAF662|nr:rhomboid family intramembrane serine protease [Nocardioides sp. YIM 152315]MDF1604478.1 rhomboid family intramembrane serine protease [Nocardioides sp. YIM 152315]
MTDHPAPAGVPTCYRHPGRESHIRCQRCDRPICPDCMRDAAVGFQCPECVATGRKETRTGRTAYGGLRPTNASVTSGVLIAVNAAVWIAIMVTGGSGSRLVDLLGLRPSGLCLVGNGGYDVPEALCTAQGGSWLPGVADGAWWQLVTSGFTHVTITHIGFNMLALWMIGPQLEMVLGRTRFLALYLVSLLAGSTVVMWAAGEYQLTLGASGAIYGLFGALIIVARRVGGDMRALWGLIIVNVLITFAVPNISWQGHLGGFVGGVLATGILVYAPRRHRAAYQALGLVALVAVLAIGAVARIAQLS